jgi:hypothetical protein
MTSSNISAKVQGLANLEAKLLRLGGPEFEKKIKDANSKNADEFLALVRSIIPRGTEDSHLANTLQRFDQGPTGAGVSIGDAEHKYPLHLEAGHRNKGGQHVPGKAYWFPAKRLQSKRWRARTRRAANAMIKAIAATGITSVGD